jgi:hypothetical protein
MGEEKKKKSNRYVVVLDSGYCEGLTNGEAKGAAA